MRHTNYRNITTYLDAVICVVVVIVVVCSLVLFCDQPMKLILCHVMAYNYTVCVWRRLSDYAGQR